MSYLSQELKIHPFSLFLTGPRKRMKYSKIRGWVDGERQGSEEEESGTFLSYYFLFPLLSFTIEIGKHRVLFSGAN